MQEKKSSEEVKASVESKVREEMETLLGTSLEEISGGVEKEDDIIKSCTCGVALAFA